MSDNTNKGELIQKIERLQQECNELAATVEAFTTVISERFTGKESQPDGTIITDGASWALELLKTTPQQHLRDVEAKAGRAGYLQGIHDWQLAESKYEDFDTQSRSLNYAESVKAGEK